MKSVRHLKGDLLEDWLTTASQRMLINLSSQPHKVQGSSKRIQTFVLLVSHCVCPLKQVLICSNLWLNNLIQQSHCQNLLANLNHGIPVLKFPLPSGLRPFHPHRASLNHRAMFVWMSQSRNAGDSS
jgi:hypothetical protein